MLPLLLVSLIVVVTFSVNFTMINATTKNGTPLPPPGADYGNYLTQVDILNGNDLRGLGLRHQPVFFIFLDILMKVFDELTALKVAASLIFSLISIPFYFFTKKLSGNSLAALISTGLFAFFVTYTEMISWGGNPNFLGFSLMLIALYFVIELMNAPSKKRLFLTGFFLSLIIGTHILVATFTFISLLGFIILSLILNTNRKDKIKRNFKNVFYLLFSAALFSLPYVSFYLDFFKNSSSELGFFRILSFQGSSISLGDLWTIVPDYFIIAFVVGILGIFGLSIYVKKNKNAGLLLCSIYLTPLLLFLVTVQPDRWIYFLPIPMFLSLSIFLGALLPDVKHSKKNTITLFTILFLVTIALTSIKFAGVRFDNAKTFYQFINEEEFNALNWIANSTNTPPDARFATSGYAENVGGGGNSYAWWVEGYSNRVCAFTGNVEFFSYKFECDETRIVNRIFAGTYSAEYNGIKVTEGFPAGTINPEIAALIGDKYQRLLTLNDVQHQIFFSSAEDQNVISIAPFYAESKISSVDYSNSTAKITVKYEQPQFELTRRVIMSGDSSSIDIIFNISPRNVTIGEFKVIIWSLFETSLENCNVDANSVVTLSQGSSANSPDTVISVADTNGELLGARVVFDNPKSSRPAVTYQFKPLQTDLSIHFQISVDVPPSEEKNEVLNFYDSYVLLKDLKVDYILLNKARENEYQRFHADTSHFTEEFTLDNKIIIFKVLK